MFNLQGGEIIMILLLALVVLGPEKLPDAMRRAGQFYAELKKMSSSFQSEFRSVIDEPMREVRNTADLLRDSADFSKLSTGERAEKPKSAEMVAPRDPAAAEPTEQVPFDPDAPADAAPTDAAPTDAAPADAAPTDAAPADAAPTDAVPSEDAAATEAAATDAAATDAIPSEDAAATDAAATDAAAPDAVPSEAAAPDAVPSEDADAAGTELADAGVVDDASQTEARSQTEAPRPFASSHQRWSFDARPSGTTSSGRAPGTDVVPDPGSDDRPAREDDRPVGADDPGSGAEGRTE